eukprot:MONOS_7643.1-p1 / transcript=MONOS_7643.1 / gene=MONOS_7643 / organism=Monocercomonoides_exilis_PA203 / gene_product=unspecified product / transcript_product=unspecified product / location=Mono_scaffold00267:132-1688(-) / protein_length=346 / sequence_SO=supercontig / SO=protein_coding / is_pseudo=false
MHAVQKLTVGLSSTYGRCCPEGRWGAGPARRRQTLTVPCDGVQNMGKDNEVGELIVRSGDVFANSRGKGARGYVVEGVSCRTDAGPVYRCVRKGQRQGYGMRISRGTEEGVLEAVREGQLLERVCRADPRREANIIVPKEQFVSAGHVVTVTEGVKCTLEEYIRRESPLGIPLPFVRTIVKQLLDALILLKDMGIRHSNLTLQSIGVREFPEVCVMDLSNAAFVDNEAFGCPPLRVCAPEQILGYPYECLCCLLCVWGCFNESGAFFLVMAQAVGGHRHVELGVRVLLDVSGLAGSGAARRERHAGGDGDAFGPASAELASWRGAAGEGVLQRKSCACGERRAGGV